MWVTTDANGLTFSKLVWLLLLQDDLGKLMPDSTK